MSSKSTFTINILIPELFPLVAFHLPLYATPWTLAALALTNHRIYEIVSSLLYSRLILRNEKDVLSISQRIQANAELGQAVRELHVMSELSVATRNGETAFDVVTGLIMLVEQGYLPYMHTLSVHLSENWRRDENYHNINGFGRLPSHFWEDVEYKCPCLQTLVLSGIGDHESDPWLQESRIYDLKGMKLGLIFERNAHVQYDGPEMLLRNICNLSPSLHTLILGLFWASNLASPILSLNFPQLRSLTLAGLSIPDTSEAMTFWRWHPLIEKLKFRDTNRNSHWFSEIIDGEHFLPNLKYLEVSFHDVRSLIPILPRLIGLSVQQSMNAQVPYLLRFLIPAGLPNLESLEINQSSSINREQVYAYDGSSWYETPDGEFHTEKKPKNATRTFMENYIHSIVRGTPNIKELCLHGNPLHPLTMERLGPELAEFGNLERLYFRGVNDGNTLLRTQKNRDSFYTSSRIIAEKCKALRRITDISNSPYLAVKIRRDHAGEVEEAIPTEGYGMAIGSEDEAFPRNPRALVKAC